MIWRIIATGGALSFLFTGFSVLGNPNCVTADIGGGGRVVGVTCRQDYYGAWSGSAAGGIMFLIGTSLLVLIYWNKISNLIGLQKSVYKRPIVSTKSDRDSNYPKTPSSSTLKSQKNSILPEDIPNIKICDKCKSEVHEFYPKCFQCEGTTFTHKQVNKEMQSTSASSEEAMWDAFQESKGEPGEVSHPEFKTCPMCAEEIKFAARKCRYCHHLLESELISTEMDLSKQPKKCKYCKKPLPLNSGRCPDCLGPIKDKSGQMGDEKCKYCKQIFSSTDGNCPNCFPANS